MSDKHICAMQVLTKQEIAAVSGGRMNLQRVTPPKDDYGVTWVHEIIQTTNGIIVHPCYRRAELATMKMAGAAYSDGRAAPA